MKSTLYYAKVITIVLSFCLLFSVTAEARFNYNQNNNGEWVASTTTNSKDGLGQILRDLGVQPNWSNRSWVTEIGQVNPNTLDSKGNIQRYGEQLNIPIKTLRNCKGYSALVIKLSGINTGVTNSPVKLKTESIPPVVAPTIPEATAPPIVTDKYQGMKQVSENKTKFFHLWAGVGMSRASNEDVASNTSTALLTDASFHLGTNLKLNLSKKLITELFVQADYRKYKDPDNLIVEQNKKLYLSFGFNLAYWLKSNFRLGFFAESANTPRSNLISSTTIEATNDSFIKLGPSVLLPFSLNNPSDLTIDLRPSFILSKDVNGVEYDSGFGLKTMINYYFGGSPLFTGFDFNYEVQNNDNVDNNLIDGYIKIGYAI